MKQKPPIIVVSGASGSGKTSLCRLLAGHFDFHYSVSHTTRPRRAGETAGRDYHFVSQEKFDRMREQGELLEWALVYGNFYGTSRQEVEGAVGRGKGVILDLDTQGARSIKKKLPKACGAIPFLIFVKAPSEEELKRRLSMRGSESLEVIKKRLIQASYEESFMNEYDYVVVNTDLNQAFGEISEVIRKKFPQVLHA